MKRIAMLLGMCLLSTQMWAANSADGKQQNPCCDKKECCTMTCCKQAAGECCKGQCAPGKCCAKGRCNQQDCKKAK